MTAGALIPADGGDADRKMTLLQNGQKMLSEARSIADLMVVRDYAESARYYERQRGVSLEAMNDAAELKIRAERRIGETLKAMKDAREIGPGRKYNTLSDLGVHAVQSSRYQRIASVPGDMFEAHIRDVRDAGQELTTASVVRLAKSHEESGREAVAEEAGCTVADLDALAASGKKFGTIYVDPPWDYSNRGTRANVGNHYAGTMTLDEIAALPVRALAADLCHLHLWTTNAFLFDCPRLMDAWGFKYQGVFVWCKPQMGIGNCWRVSHEFLLLAIRGEPRKFPVHNLMSWAAIDRGEHSVKPHEVRVMIEKASPSPRLELFARVKHDGWDAWGNQIPRTLWDEQTDRQPSDYDTAPPPVAAEPSLFDQGGQE